MPSRRWQGQPNLGLGSVKVFPKALVPIRAWKFWSIRVEQTPAALIMNFIYSYFLIPRVIIVISLSNTRPFIIYCQTDINRIKARKEKDWVLIFGILFERKRYSKILLFRQNDWGKRAWTRSHTRYWNSTCPTILLWCWKIARAAPKSHQPNDQCLSTPFLRFQVRENGQKMVRWDKLSQWG